GGSVGLGAEVADDLLGGAQLHLQAAVLGARAHVAGQQHILQPRQRAAVGLVAVDVQSGGQVGPGQQRVVQGGLVDDRPAGGVDQHGTRPEASQLGRTDQAAGQASQGQVQGDD